MADVYLAGLSNKPGASTVLLLNGEPPSTGYFLRSADLGNATFDKIFSGARGTQGALLAGETAQNRSSTFRLRVQGTSKDDLYAKLSALWALEEDLRHFGGWLTWRAWGATYKMRLKVLDSGIALEQLEPQLFVRNNSVHVVLTIVSPPYAEGDSMDVVDTFATSSSGDYGFDSGSSSLVTFASTSLQVAGGNLTTERRLILIDPGYSYGDHQVTVIGKPGTVVTSFKLGVVLKRIDASNYLEVYVDDNGTNSRLRIDKVVAGTRTNLSTTNLAARIVASTAFGVRGRLEGNIVYADYGATTMLAIPTLTGSVTLTGGDATLFGGAGVGEPGISWLPQEASSTVTKLQVDAFVRRQVTAPAVIDFSGVIPGDADALVDIGAGVEGSLPNAIPWALFAWGSGVSGVSQRPFGIFEAESMTLSGGWTVTADANYRGGSGAKLTTSGVAAPSAQVQVVHTDAIRPDDYRQDEFDIEVWARVELASTLVSPRLILSSGLGGGSRTVYSNEYGKAGRALTLPSSGTAFRFVRLGTLTLPIASAQCSIKIDGSVAAGSTGQFGLDYIVLCFANLRALSPTGKPFDANYPTYIPSAGGNALKVIRSDLAGVFGSMPDPGLGGSLIEIPPGVPSLIVKVASIVPDDPTASAASEGLSQLLDVQLTNVRPRWRLGRSS